MEVFLKEMKNELKQNPNAPMVLKSSPDRNPRLRDAVGQGTYQKFCPDHVSVVSPGIEPRSKV